MMSSSVRPCETQDQKNLLNPFFFLCLSSAQINFRCVTEVFKKQNEKHIAG